MARTVFVVAGALDCTMKSLRSGMLASCLLAAVLFLFPSSAEAAWVPIGPFGGDVRSLVADPQNPDLMYLGTRTGQVYRSADGGKRWSRLTGLAAPPNWVVDDLLIEPQEPQGPREPNKPQESNKPREPNEPKVLYAGMWSLGSGGGGVFKSSDGGVSWTELVGVAGQAVRALAMAPSNPQVLVAGSLDGVFRSEDSGGHWRRISPLGHPELRNLESVAIDPRDPQIIYVGTWHLPWKTTDGGAHWNPIHQGMIDDSDVFSLVVNPSDRNNLYLGACTGIYRSDTAATEWRKIQGMPASSRRTHTLVLDPRHPSVVYAGTTEGLWQTRNGGQTWARLTPQTWVINAVALDSRDPSHFYLGMDHAGVMESRDGGKTFREANGGFSQRQVSRLVADPQGPGRFYAGLLHDGEFGGVYATQDDGATWQQRSAGLGTRDVLSLLILPQPAWRLLAGTPDGVFEYSAEQGVWQNKSRWEIPPDQSGGGRRATLRQAQGQERSRLATVRDLYQRSPGEPIYAATSRGLFESKDGREWKKLSLSHAGGAYEVASFGEGGRTILAATDHAMEISRDAGRSWSPLGLGADSKLKIHRITTHPASPNRVFVGTDIGLFRSTDSGLHWERFGRGLPFSAIVEILIAPHNPLHILVTGRAGMFQSLDGGDRFQRLGDGEGPEDLLIQSVAIHPWDGPSILAASVNNGIFLNGKQELLLSHLPNR